MNIVLVAAAAVLGLSSATAFAGEGRGSPFSLRVPGIESTTSGLTVTPSATADPYPYRGSSTVMTPAMSAGMLPSASNQGEVQSANSMPKGSERGTAAYQEGRAVQRYWQAQAAHAGVAAPPQG